MGEKGEEGGHLLLCIPYKTNGYRLWPMPMLTIRINVHLINFCKHHLLNCQESLSLPLNIANSSCFLIQGLLGLAQSLCAFGCVVDVSNGSGHHPLHLAAANGHTEVARYEFLTNLAHEQFKWLIHMCAWRFFPGCLIGVKKVNSKVNSRAFRGVEG